MQFYVSFKNAIMYLLTVINLCSIFNHRETILFNIELQL